MINCKVCLKRKFVAREQLKWAKKFLHNLIALTNSSAKFLSRLEHGGFTGARTYVQHIQCCQIAKHHKILVKKRFFAIIHANKSNEQVRYVRIHIGINWKEENRALKFYFPCLLTVTLIGINRCRLPNHREISPFKLAITTCLRDIPGLFYAHNRLTLIEMQLTNEPDNPNILGRFFMDST